MKNLTVAKSFSIASPTYSARLISRIVRHSTIITMTVAIIAAILSLTYYAIDSPAKAGAGQRLKAIIEDSYHPYSFLDDKGKPDGFSIDIARAVAKEMDLELEMRAGRWDMAMNELETGNIDMIPLIAYTPQRGKLLDFTVPYTIVYDAIFFKKGTTGIRSLNDLSGKTVIVTNNDLAHNYLLSSGLSKAMTIILAESGPDALKQLSAGKGDAAIMPKLIGLFTVKKLNLSDIETAPQLINGYNRIWCLAVKKGNQALVDRLNQGLSAIKISGEYDAINKKWFGAMEASYFKLKTVFQYGSVAALMLLGFIVWNVLLKRLVKAKTQHLEAEIAERKQAEQALCLHGEIMANMTEGVILIRVKDGVIVYANPKLEEMFCYHSGELIGKHISIVNAPSEKSPEETAQAIVSHLHENGIWRGEVNCRKKDNSHFWCYANVSTFNHKEYGEVWISVHSDISDRKTIMAELESSYQQLRVFNQRWVEIEELERKRLSAELHDEIGQNLTALGINFTIVKMSLPPGTDSIVYDRIDESMDLLKRTTAQIKGIMSNLRPTILDEYGLVPALHWYSQENAKRTGIEISFAAEELPFRPVTEIETALFRIAQEAITNSIKHAGANCISMTLDYAENRLYLAITDDGAGFEMQMVQKQDNRGWGLMIMKERCLGTKGIFNVESIPGQGTKISVEVPL